MLRSEAEQSKEQILTLKKRVNLLQEQELKAAATDSEIQLKLQKLKDLEAEAEKLRESNFRLHLENSELARQLGSTQILANSVLEDPEVEELRELSNRLRQENADLAKEVERLQAGRCTDLEELVYLRWINACLRYELRNFRLHMRDPFARKSGIGNLFVKNLDSSIDSARLESMFCKFGTILSCKVAEEHGKSKGFGFVQFDSEYSALAARTALHDTMLEGKKLYVSKFIKKSERTAPTLSEESNFTNLYVKNLADNITEDTLQNMFAVFGKVCNVVIMKDHEGTSRGFGFVNFDSPEGAKKAVDALNGSLLGSRTLFVGRAQKKAERIKILQHADKDIFNNHIEKLKLSNVYVKNLDVRIDDNKLREIFSACGKIVSAKVMRYDNGVSRKFGFVCFSSPEEAKKALNTLNGIMFGRKSLYVAIARCRRDRHPEQGKYFAARQSQSLYPSNCNVIAPPIGPPYYNLPTFHPPISFRQHPISYQNFGANMGVQCPLGVENYQQQFYSYVRILFYVTDIS
ncbi:hypothetical protein GH714_020064 [Hevea brasiliensis]|uniref:RRM domain-containing protein n=1 Tax=Hevea brasiliensis TaxID=3981 RepID=A0A6A6LN98_HEVBR|nr:hypothetical protein GH714_020064 [Hevea brasiliensis]